MLHGLDQNLVARAGFRIETRDRLAVGIRQAEHEPAAQIRIVRNDHGIDAVAAIVVGIGPKIFRARQNQRVENGASGYLGPRKITLRCRLSPWGLVQTPFIGDECRKFARLIEFLGRVDLILPIAAADQPVVRNSGIGGSMPAMLLPTCPNIASISLGSGN